jgi:hypothetical protein
MDLLFGTYVCPPSEPEAFGIKEPFPKNYLAQLIKPVLPHFMIKLFPDRNNKDKLTNEIRMKVHVRESSLAHEDTQSNL